MSSIFQIAMREWKRILTIPAHYIVLLIIPPVLFCVYAYIYRDKQADNLPIAIWDEDNSSTSRLFTYMLEQSNAIRITASVDNTAEIRKLIMQGKVLGAVHFPLNMEADIKSRHPVKVTLYTNAAALVPAKLIYKDAAQVIITAGAGVTLQKLVKQGMKAEKAMAIVMPVSLTTYTLYNPTYNYQEYLVPGLLTVAVQMIIIIVAVLLLNYELKTETIHELKQLAKGSASNVILGKTLAHLSVAWLNLILIAGIIFPAFQMGHTDGLLNLFVVYTLLALACIGIGLMISAIFKDVMLASDIALFYTSPAFVFSGYTFPRWAMPWYDQYYAMIMPYSSFLDAFVKVYNMQLPLIYALPECGKMMLFIAVTFFVAIVLFQYQLNRLKPVE